MAATGAGAMAMVDGRGAFVGERDVIVATGADTVGFLQGQLSQDIAGLAVGASAASLLLQPQGKVDAWLRVTRLGEEQVVIDVEAGWGEATLARLNRFKLRTRCDLVLERWGCVFLRGSGWRGVEPGSFVGSGSGSGSGAVVAAPVRWPGSVGFDLLGPAVVAPEGAEEVDAEAFEALRIACGVPALGRELDGDTIPAEAGEWLTGESVSFTKGCYTGQELVARVDSRGSNTPRRLRAIIVDGASAAARPPQGAAVYAGDALVATLTSVAWSEARAAAIGLALVKRSVEPPAQARLVWEGGEAMATIVEVPPVVAT